MFGFIIGEEVGENICCLLINRDFFFKFLLKLLLLKVLCLLGVD